MEFASCFVAEDIEFEDINDEKLLQDTRECSTILRARYGTISPAWKDVNKIVRGNQVLPIAGGPDTMRAVYTKFDESINSNRMIAGDGLHFIVSWDNQQQQKVWGIHQYGSSRDTDSIHYADQVEAFSKQELLQVKPQVNPISRKVKYP